MCTLLHNSGMLIHVAAVGYGREPDFELRAPDEPGMAQRIAYALRTDPVFRAAAAAEGIDPDRTPDPASLARRADRHDNGNVKVNKRRGGAGGRRGRTRAKL